MMNDAPQTRASLLLRIRDARDSQAWAQFVEVYAPLIYDYGRRHSLQDADAADLVQDVFRTVSSAIRKLDYDARRGTFRGWLLTVARTRLIDLFQKRSAPGRGSGESGVQLLLQDQPAAESEDQWNADYERRVFAWAAERVQKEVQEATWQAFWQTAVEGKSGSEVASALGMTLAAVYLAKSRVMARLKQQIESVKVNDE